MKQVPDWCHLAVPGTTKQPICFKPYWVTSRNWSWMWLFS